MRPDASTANASGAFGGRVTCEHAFQGGHGRAQVRDGSGNLRMSCECRAAAIRFANVGDVVWYRAKVRGEPRYTWQATKVRS
jgi:hypothetical protein